MIIVMCLLVMYVSAGGDQNTEMVNEEQRPETSEQVQPGVNDDTGDQASNTDLIDEERDQTKNFEDRFN